MRSKIGMYRVYPTKWVQGFTHTYCETIEEAEGEQARMMAWTGVKWKIEKVVESEDKITY